MYQASAASARPLWPIVVALGISQIVSYGTLYYVFALIAPHVSLEMSASQELLFGSLSAGFLAGGLLSPFSGKMMDRWGAARVMTYGSVAVAALFLLAAASPTFIFFAAATVAMQIMAVSVEYDAAFATINQAAGARSQQTITRLTLIAGLSSTLFWPLTGWLLEASGWRMTYVAFAAMHLLLLAPLHYWLWQRSRKDTPAANRDELTQASPATPSQGGRKFWFIAISFAMSTALITALGTHLVPLLTAKQLGASAYSVSMLVGPAQVAIRLTNATVWRNLHPLGSALIAALALPVSAALLLWSSQTFVIAAAFAIIFGVGQGLFSITRGTVPLALFGPLGYGALLGKLAAVRTLLSATAPFAFAVAWHRYGVDAALLACIIIGTVAAVPLALLRKG